ncbi:MAG: hypothetical protein EAX81_06515 [Candidatus Thorarchaeota archaeon]|nr:hypothetical protein [Candidatus Thorarchaeota archaeon]
MAVIDEKGIMRCEECNRKGRSSKGKKVHFCSLCGELRCEDHTVWVPAHLIDKLVKSSGLLMTKPIDGWYAFCTRSPHIPQGVSIWFGRQKKRGRVVENILPSEKTKGLEQFAMWETGRVEEGFENHFNVKDYEISCAIFPVMRLILHIFTNEDQNSRLALLIHSLVFKSVAATKPLLFPVEYEDLISELGESPTLDATLRFVCSRCGVVVCMNRQAPFFDRARFGHLARRPETIIPIDIASSK